MRISLFFISLLLMSFTPIGHRIWKNECGGKREGLTSWNKGEAFASLGIGHFIWYPEGKRGPFHETFPDLILFLKEKGVNVPNWLIQTPCPWTTREEFISAIDTPKMDQLRELLFSTIDEQTAFIIHRFEQSIVGSHPQAKGLLKHPAGAFALIDYLNFKGEGTSEKERYQGVGWGLLQVLNKMEKNRNPLEAFVTAAKDVLRERVKNAPKERAEERWLLGWENRIDRYLE